MSQKAPASATRILDSALEIACTDGPSAITMTAVAQRAGLSRMTVHRHFADRATLLAALFTRELGPLLVQPADSAPAGPTARDRVVAAVATAVDRVRHNALMDAVLTHEPEYLIRWIVDHPGVTQRLALDSVTTGIAAGQRPAGDGSVRRGDVAAMAAAVLVTAQSFVFSSAMAPATDELSHLVDAYLRPDPGSTP